MPTIAVDQIVETNTVHLLVKSTTLLAPTLEELNEALPVAVTATAGVDSFTEAWNAPDGVLGTTATAKWTPEGTRWTIASQQAKFIGSGFGAEIARCSVPVNSETYTLRAPLAGWNRGSATDVSLGLLVRMPAAGLVNGVAVLMTQTATTSLLNLWRYLDGVAVPVFTLPLVASPGEVLEVQTAERDGQSRIVVALGGIRRIDYTDSSLPASGRYIGIIGYAQGGAGDADLRLGPLTLAASPPPLVINSMRPTTTLRPVATLAPVVA